MTLFYLNREKGGYFGPQAPDADVASGPRRQLTWHVGPPRGATRR